MFPTVRVEYAFLYLTVQIPITGFLINFSIIFGSAESFIISDVCLFSNYFYIN